MTPTSIDEGINVRLPEVEERLRIDKERVVTGRFVAASTVSKHDVTVNEPLETVTIRIERVPVGRFVDTAPVIRSEGDRTIVPVTEEVMVKRLRLVEEVHLIRERTIVPFEDEVTLRRLNVDIERTGPDRGDV